jgi:hypothetical protein
LYASFQAEPAFGTLDSGFGSHDPASLTPSLPVNEDGLLGAFPATAYSTAGSYPALALPPDLGYQQNGPYPAPYPMYSNPVASRPPPVPGHSQQLQPQQQYRSSSSYQHDIPSVTYPAASLPLIPSAIPISDVGRTDQVFPVSEPQSYRQPLSLDVDEVGRAKGRGRAGHGSEDEQSRRTGSLRLAEHLQLMGVREEADDTEMTDRQGGRKLP